MQRRTIIVFVALLLSGCAAGPQQLGLSSQQWQMMSKTMRQETQMAYQAIQKSDARPTSIYNGPDIQVLINKGMAMMPPFLQAYPFEATTFKLHAGECQSVRLTGWDWEQRHSVNLRACYDGLTLRLDPSRYDPTKSKGTLLITYNPLWRHGFTYSGLSSSGYVRLEKTDITIHAISNLAPVKDVNPPSA